MLDIFTEIFNLHSYSHKSKRFSIKGQYLASLVAADVVGGVWVIKPSPHVRHPPRVSSRRRYPPVDKETEGTNLNGKRLEMAHAIVVRYPKGRYRAQYLSDY